MKNIIAIILIAISVGIFYINIQSQYADTLTLWADYNHYTKALSDADKQKDLGDQLKKERDSFTQTDIDNIGKLIPDTFDVTIFTAEMNTLSSAYGASVKNMKATAPAQQVASSGISVNQNPYKTTQVSFDVDTTYENFTKFLVDIEKDLRIVDVTGVSFRPVVAVAKGVVVNSAVPIYGFTITAQTYSLK